MSKEHWTAKAGVFLALAVAVIYFFQWRAMVDTVTITRRVSERDERAWIKVTPGIAPKPLANQSIHWPMSMQKIGKTPAHNVVGYFVIDVIPNGSTLDFDYSKFRPSERSSRGINYPREFPARRSSDTIALQIREQYRSRRLPSSTV